jgi:hypothetical protein
MLEQINRPDIDKAVSVLYEMSSEFGFRLAHYVTRIRSLYTDEEWYSMSQASVVKLLQLGLISMVGRCALTQPACRYITGLGLTSPRRLVA